MNRIHTSVSHWHMVTIVALATLAITACGMRGTARPTNEEAGSTSAVGTASIGTRGFSSDALSAASTLGVIVDLTGRVVDFEAGSAAQQAGVSLGDTVVALDDVPVARALSQATTNNVLKNDDAALNAIRNKVATGKALTIRLQRKGQETSVVVTPSVRPGQAGQPTPTAVPQNQWYM